MRTDQWQRLRPLLDRALELEGEARRRYVDSLEDLDNDLDAELRRLVAEHDALGPQTVPNAIDLAAPAISEREQEDAALDEQRVGQSIGPYRLVRLLGAGGMGAVYLAERGEGPFAHSVALKVVRRALGSPQARDRFERERQILARLKHAGIALLFDGGQTREGQSYYTMEHVDGEPITDFCTRRGEPPAGRVRLLQQVAVTLAYAHQNLIVHRDIKPSNVLVTPEGRVKLIDFGLAKLLDDHLMPTMTQTGLGPMTPVYAAPEQFEGKATTTVATDIYQFGVLCYYVLSGSLPYRPNPNDSLRWARAVLEEEPMTLARAARDATRGTVRQKRRNDLPADLDAIVRKCLAKRPQERYQSADTLIRDFDAFLDGRPVTAHAAGLAYFAWRFLLRHRYLVAATATSILVLAIAGIAALWQSRLATQHAERAQREAEIRDVTRAMLTDLLRVGPASASSKVPHSALEALDEGTERTLSALGSNPQHRAIAAAVLAQSYLDLDHPQRARDLIERIRPMLENLDLSRSEGLQLDLLLARAEAALGNAAASRLALDRAWTTIGTLALPVDSPYRLSAELARVQLTIHEGHQEEARRIATNLLAANDRPALNQTLEFAALLTMNVPYVDDRISELDLLERAWKITAAHYGADSPAALAAQRYLIEEDLKGPHRFDDDRILAEQQAQTRESFGEQSLDYADVLRLRCHQNEDARQYAEAETCWRQFIAIYQDKAPDSEMMLATADDRLGVILLRLHRPGEALPLFENELALRSRTFAPTYSRVIHARLQIAETRCLLGEIDSALVAFDVAMIDYVASLGPRHPNEAIHGARLANCLIDAGRITSARRILEQHADLEPPRKGMNEASRAEIRETWKRLESGTSGRSVTLPATPRSLSAPRPSRPQDSQKSPAS